ncbi:MAG: hypothetical protein IKN32_01000 [Bacteroidales bacterium]|nr:hypothetical protein [Bacteroidales bacterium]
MTKQEYQKFTSILIRIETKLNRIESMQATLNELFTLHLGDAQNVSDLQRKLKEANDRIRELENEKYFKEHF